MMRLKAVSTFPPPLARARLALTTHCRTFLSGPVSGNPFQSLLGKLSVLSGTIFSGLAAFGSAAMAAGRLAAAKQKAAKQAAAIIVANRSRAVLVHTAFTGATIAGGGRRLKQTKI